MEQISELLTALTGTLERQVRTQITNNWPAIPTAIVYADETSYEAQKEIMATLQQVWRGRAEAVCQMVIRDGKYHLVQGDDPWRALTEDEVQEQIDELFAQEQNFRVMSDLLLVMIQNTAGCTDLEQFAKGYRAVDELKSQLGITACKTMKIVLLDESSKGRAMAKEIRTYLRESMSAGEEASKATTILSNRLKNGVLLTGRRIQENYALAGHLILLANNSNNHPKETFAPKYSRMFPVKDPHFVTASYTHDSKPNRAICEVLLNATLSWLEGKFSEGDLLSTDLMSKKLSITGGTMKTLDRFFNQNIADRLPPKEVLEYLPRVGMNLDNIGHLPYKEYDRITMGGFNSFYENTVLPKCVSEGLKRQFREFFKEQMRGKFTPKEAARSITPQSVEQVLSQLRQETISESRPAVEYMVERAKADYCKMVLPVCEEVLLEIGKTAQDYIKEIAEISEEFQHSYMLDVDDTVQQYYHELAAEKLESSLGEQLLEVFDKPDLSKAEMIEELEQIIKLIFTSNKIFGLPLQEELTLRMGGNAAHVQSIIQKELTDGLGDSIRLQTAIVPEIMFETMFVNKRDDNGEDGLFYNYLSQTFSNADCLDTGNRNAVEFVQLYVVDTHTL